MHVHRLNSRVGAVLAIGLAIAAAVVTVERHSASFPPGVKGDRLEVTVPQSGCSQVVWPYGCDWQSNATSDTKKHSRFGRRGRQYWLKRFVS
jgi:hypothetical protein